MKLCEEQIHQLESDNPETVQHAACEWNAAGFLIAPGEQPHAFAARLRKLMVAEAQLQRELRTRKFVEPYPGIKLSAGRAIPSEIVSAAGAVTEALYGIRVEWVPGFYVTERMGFLWGGCSFSDPESLWNIFIIRSEFQKKERWFLYRRTELLAHELCHAARQALDDIVPEELFAYRTSKGRVRSFLGNSFVYRWDAWLFLGGVMLMLAAQILRVFCRWETWLPLWPFIGLAVAGPLFLLLRNLHVRRVVARAETMLSPMTGKENAPKVAFQLTYGELQRIAQMRTPAELGRFFQESPRERFRFAVLQRRFFPNGKEEAI